MRYLLEQSRIQHLIRNRNGYLLLSLGSIFVNCLLVMLMFYTLGREKIIIVPPEIQKSFWVTSNTVSPEYLSEMAMFLSSLSFNVSPSNAAMQHAILLRYVDPTYYSSYKMELMNIEEKIKKERIAISFYPVDVSVDTKKLIARVSGDLVNTIGDIQLTPTHVIYQFGFSYKLGQLKISSFHEIKSNE